MIRKFTSGDGPALYRLWKTEGCRFGYAPLSEQIFRELLLEHPDFFPDLTFVMEEAGHICGFINGCVGGPNADTGYIGCLLLKEQADTEENTALLVRALEDEFRKARRKS